MDIYRILYQATAECTFISSAYRMWIKICWAIKVSINLKGLKLYGVHSMATKELNLNITNSKLSKNPKCLEIDTFLNKV